MSVSMSSLQVAKPRPNYAYMLSGWRTRSEIPLSCVPTIVNDEKVDDVRIQIAHGNSPVAKPAEPLAWTRFEHSSERSWISIAGVADFDVVRGEQVLVWPAAGAAPKDIEIFLYGVVWATLCHQREMLPLHASAIAVNGGIVAFAGHPGAGKSTTAALMASLGHELITDDILPVSFGQNCEPGAWPYLRRLKLRQDAITRLALTPIEPVGKVLDKKKSFVRPRDVTDHKWRKLERLYLLEIDPNISRISINQITGVDAVRVFIDQTYHFAYLRGSPRLREHLELCVRLASKIRVYRLRRPPSSSIGDDIGEKLCTHIAERSA